MTLKMISASAQCFSVVDGVVVVDDVVTVDVVAAAVVVRSENDASGN